MKKHILLIDDDKDEHRIFIEALERVSSSFNCVWVKNTDHAVKFLPIFQPDFIFIDYSMPWKNGIQSLTDIRKIEKAKDVPIILYSAFLNDSLKTKAFSLGAFACVTKSSSVKELSENLKSILLSQPPSYMQYNQN